MTKTKILLLSLLMSLAVLGLIFFQLYWIRTAVHLKEDELARNVQEALVEVCSKLEKQEVIRYTYQQSNVKIYSNGNIQTIRFPAATLPPAPPAPDLVPEPYDSLQKRVWVEDGHVIVKIKEPGIYRTAPSAEKKFKRTQPNQVYREVAPTQARAQHRPQQQEEKEYSEAVAREIEDRLHNRQQVDMLYLRQFMAEERSLKKRLDSIQIDTLLRAALGNRGIDADYHWAVMQGPHRQLVYQSGNVLTDTASLYQAALFPNDIFRSNSYLSVYFPNQTGYLLSRMSTTLASSALLMLIVIACFGYAVHTILRQKKLSEMKTDFINNMTHELKTPIATVSMACEALADPDLQQQPNILERYLGIIRQENRRLGQQVEKVLQIARLEKQKASLKLEPVDIHALAESVADIYRLQLPPEGNINLHLNANEPTIQGDRLHLTGILNNLLENAIKYSDSAPQIEVYTQNVTMAGKDALSIIVTDKGIGISPENQEKIFDKFYRVPTGNIHNVKGFGLGLAFVRYSTDAHGGKISVQSKAGAGSRFIVTLPLNATAHAES